MCSLEEAGGAEGQGWVERPSERIAHCAEHTRAWVTAAGLELTSVRELRRKPDPCGRPAPPYWPIGRGGPKLGMA